MSGYARLRGHEIVWRDGAWFYVDGSEEHDEKRPCKRCGRLPTPEGYDPCLGEIDGVRSACYGHGVESGYIIRDKGG